MNPTLYPPLYSLDSLGNIRVWRMEQNNNKYRTHSGIKDGEIVISNWTVVEGKNIGRSNETTATEQAISETQSKYTKQLKSGYFNDIEDARAGKTSFVEPMLAKKLNDRLDKITFPAILDRKYNGGRVIITKKGCFSRKGEEWKTIPHIFESVKFFFEKFPNLVLDGEAYNHDYRYNLNDLMSILRKTKNITGQDIKSSREIIKFYCYDGYNFVDSKQNFIVENTACEKRRAALNELLVNIPYVVAVKGVMVKSLDDLYKNYQEFVEDGYEGGMYRSLDGHYKHGRSADLLKVKPEDSSEGVVTFIKEGDGNWSGAAKICSILWKNGGEDKIFNATFKGSHEKLSKILNNPKQFLDKTVTFLYNGLTGKGIPNFARVDVNNCFKS